MVKRTLMLLMLLTLLVGYARADNDTLLTFTQYGYRIAHFMNMADTANGTVRMPAAKIRTYARMAFATIAHNVAIEKTKYLPVVKNTRKYLVDNGLIMVRDVSKIKNNTTVPLREILVAEDVLGHPTYKQEAGGEEYSQFYQIAGDSIRLFPTPAYSDTVVIEYLARPALPSTDTAAVNIPYEYRNSLIFLAAFLCEVAVRGPNHEIYWNLYSAEVESIKTRVTEKWRVVQKASE